MAAAGLLMAGAASAHSAKNSPPAHQTAASEDRATEVQRRVLAAAEKLQKRDVKSAKSDLLAIKNDPQFATLPPQLRYMVLRALAFAEVVSDDAEVADADFQQAEKLATPSDPGHYMLKAEIARSLHRTDAEVGALTAMIDKYPQFASTLPYTMVQGLVEDAKTAKDADASRRHLLESLHSAHYQSDSVFQDTESLWFQLFEIYVGQHVDAGADQLLGEFNTPEAVIRLRCDKRYRPMWDTYIKSHPEKADFKHLLSLWVDEARTLAKAQPRELAGVNMLARRLMYSNQLDDAQRVLETAIAAVKAAPKAPPFDDMTKEYNWTLDLKSRILQLQGRTEQVAQAKEAARTVADEQKSDPVSQKLNLGAYYVETGEPQKALDAIRDYDESFASPYGRMVAAKVRVCASAQLKRKTDTDTALAYMTTHAQDSMVLLREALTCVDDEDGLAKLILQNLDDPTTRNDMLFELQCFLSLTNATDVQKKMSVMQRNVLTRPEIKAAIAKYGFTETYPMVYPKF